MALRVWVTALNRVLFPTLGRPTIPALNIPFHLRVTSHSGSFEVVEWHDEGVQFEEELERVLPPDLPNRQLLIRKAAQHLALIAAVNEHMNLTRLTNPREAAIKHVYDSVIPWEFFRDARRVLDAGTGAGFPGVPLAVIMPEVQFTLSESIQKKARFVESVVERLDLTNVHVTHERAEDVATNGDIDIITARAVAPISRILDLFRKPLNRGTRLVLYKGPDVEPELAEAHKFPVKARVLCRYDLPQACGSRSLLEVTAKRAEREKPRHKATASQE
jgi:16S rRNA (guanine527-N7)-methyltransferase